MPRQATDGSANTYAHAREAAMMAHPARQQSPRSRANELLGKCAGKDALTVAQAKTIARRMQRKGGTYRSLEAYRCGFCGQWHIGSSSRQRMRP